MPTTQSINLVSDHTTLKLSYEKHSSMPADSFIISLIAWPIFAMSGSIMLIYGTTLYVKLKWSQSKLIAVLTDQKHLKKYAKERPDVCDKQIEKVKHLAKFLMGTKLKRPNSVELPIPQKPSLKDQPSSKSFEEWDNFPWDRFVTFDFFQKSTVLNDPDAKIFTNLEKYRIQLNYLERQKKVLSTYQGDQKLEAIRRIAELSFVKNAFRKQEAKAMIISGFTACLPTGVYWFSPHSPHSIHEEKESSLPDQTSLKAYHGLLDAHNQLVNNHDFLVPYVANTLV